MNRGLNSSYVVVPWRARERIKNSVELLIAQKPVYLPKYCSAGLTISAAGQSFRYAPGELRADRAEGEEEILALFAFLTALVRFLHTNLRL